MLTDYEVKNLEREIETLHEFEIAMGEKLEKIKSSNPTLRPDKMYRGNISGYKTQKDRKRSYEAKRNALVGKLADHEDEVWLARQAAERRT